MAFVQPSLNYTSTYNYLINSSKFPNIIRLTKPSQTASNSGLVNLIIRNTTVIAEGVRIKVNGVIFNSVTDRLNSTDFVNAADFVTVFNNNYFFKNKWLAQTFITALNERQITFRQLEPGKRNTLNIEVEGNEYLIIENYGQGSTEDQDIKDFGFSVQVMLNNDIDGPDQRTVGSASVIELAELTNNYNKDNVYDFDLSNVLDFNNDINLTLDSNNIYRYPFKSYSLKVNQLYQNPDLTFRSKDQLNNGNNIRLSTDNTVFNFFVWPFNFLNYQEYEDFQLNSYTSNYTTALTNTIKFLTPFSNYNNNSKVIYYNDSLNYLDYLSVIYSPRSLSSAHKVKANVTFYYTDNTTSNTINYVTLNNARGGIITVRTDLSLLQFNVDPEKSIQYYTIHLTNEQNIRFTNYFTYYVDYTACSSDSSNINDLFNVVVYRNRYGVFESVIMEDTNFKIDTSRSFLEYDNFITLNTNSSDRLNIIKNVDLEQKYTLKSKTLTYGEYKSFYDLMVSETVYLFNNVTNTLQPITITGSKYDFVNNAENNADSVNNYFEIEYKIADRI